MNLTGMVLPLPAQLQLPQSIALLADHHIELPNIETALNASELISCGNGYDHPPCKQDMWRWPALDMIIDLVQPWLSGPGKIASNELMLLNMSSTAMKQPRLLLTQSHQRAVRPDDFPVLIKTYLYILIYVQSHQPCWLHWRSFNALNAFSISPSVECNGSIWCPGHTRLLSTFQLLSISTLGRHVNGGHPS